MYAIIQSGGRQVKVTPGATVEVDHFAGEAGDEVSVTSVLFVAKDGGDIVAGAPFVSGAKVVAVSCELPCPFFVAMARSRSPSRAAAYRCCGDRATCGSPCGASS